MSPPPDKIRPWVEIGCGEEGCEFRTAAEFAALRHEDETGHRMVWWGTERTALVAGLPSFPVRGTDYR